MLRAFGVTDTQRFPISGAFTVKRQSELKICTANRGLNPLFFTLQNIFNLIKYCCFIFVDLKYQRYKQIFKFDIICLQ